MGLLKNLIHVFIFLIIISFIAMIYLVSKGEEQHINNEMNESEIQFQIKSLHFYLEMFPAYYFMKKTGEQVGINVTEGVNKYANLIANQGKEDTRSMMMIHPLYVELQKQSPLGMMRDYDLVVVDQVNKPITKKYFYKNFISKSLPVLFKNEYSNANVIK